VRPTEAAAAAAAEAHTEAAAAPAPAPPGPIQPSLEPEPVEPDVPRLAVDERVTHNVYNFVFFTVSADFGRFKVRLMIVTFENTCDCIDLHHHLSLFLFLYQTIRIWSKLFLAAVAFASGLASSIAGGSPTANAPSISLAAVSFSFSLLEHLLPR